ncbi:DUF6130 family protein [Flavobacterium lindanitolerans]|uniref:Uncharacterized protein n=1 Tax=Flavobacterium lindanitolerans TaxID=428988 RepID=A0A497U1V6_9FLAO|nr:DUF6130 family protein [Flavobacterium lindanitolerans]PKW30322.1 hypothetical protein B0G92_1980 [Flavobacterium lindanitolerans]RLJ24660.1 hypothetical protein CLV50_2551 [Flavobacterium lindanitolerans]
MKNLFKKITAVAFLAGFSFNTNAQSARDFIGAPAIIPITSEPAPKLIVDAPIAEELAKAKVIVQYRTENLRILPVYGQEALKISPRIGHLHITVDNLPWHWADASNEPLIIVGMSPGKHSILFELADSTHKVLQSQLITFEIPDIKTVHKH